MRVISICAVVSAQKVKIKKKRFERLKKPNPETLKDIHSFFVCFFTQSEEEVDRAQDTKGFARSFVYSTHLVSK